MEAALEMGQRASAHGDPRTAVLAEEFAAPGGELSGTQVHAPEPGRPVGH